MRINAGSICMTLIWNDFFQLDCLGNEKKKKV